MPNLNLAVLITVGIGVGMGWAESGRVLAVLPMPGQSHHSMFQAVFAALARAGHQVTAYSTFRPSAHHAHPNYTHVQIDSIMEMGGDVMSKFIKALLYSPYRSCYDRAFKISEPMFVTTFKDKNIKRLLESKLKYDLIIIEQLAGQEFLSILGHIFQAPVIRIQAFVTNSILNSVSENSLSMSFIPDLCSPHPNKMTFTDRFLNSYYVLRQLYHYYYNYLPDLEGKMRSLFPDMPPLVDLVENVSLTFVNDHSTADYAQPRTPNIIPVGGIHIRPTQPLPQDIQQFMDEAANGVILFSMGTLTPEFLQSEQYFRMCARVFSRLQQRVLWKTRKTNMKSVPSNVLVSDWMPLQDVLSHPKCVLFVTHGGQHSLLETVHFGVPVIAVPQFFDQFRNSRFYEERGVGIMIDSDDFGENTIYEGIKRVLGDPKYAENMKQLSQLSRDVPMTPAQTVVYWADHVMRLGSNHLRPPSAHIPIYQLALLDVIAALLAVTVATLVVGYLTVLKLYRVLSYLKFTRYSKKKIS